MGLRTRVCELMAIELPIFGAGTGSIATADLAAAVTNAGGLGMTGAAGDPPEEIIARIRRIRTLTDGPIGVNVILQIQPAEVIQAILDEGVEVLATGFGDGAPWVAPAHAAGAKVFHRCETAAEARAAAAAGVDVLIAQGSDSGGHTGTTPTFSLVPQIVDAAEGRPVLAAGGIADGRGLAAALMLGADAVLVGTRFWAAAEALTPQVATDRALAASGDDTVRTTALDALRGVAWPSEFSFRVLHNALTRDWAPREAEAAKRFGTLKEAYAEARARQDLDTVAVVAGECVGLIHDRPPAATIVETMVAEAEALLARGARLDFTRMS
jgi:nitronate monooxygenase